MIPLLLFQAMMQQPETDPWLLSIGSTERIVVRTNNAYRTSDGKRVTLREIATAADGKNFVYIGEEHDNADSHRWQTLIIGALVERGREVVIGLEMLQREKQPILDLWTLGKFTEEEFLERVDWKRQWGIDYALYRPIFEFAKKEKLRMIALNIPRDWVRITSRSGWEALSSEAKSQLPEPYMNDVEHFEVFRALMGGHPGDASIESMYRGQVLWDEAMADSAIRYYNERYRSGKTVFVILAGNGHVMYRRGINFRIERRTGMSGITVVTVPVSSEKNEKRVSAGVGDFVVGIREKI